MIKKIALNILISTIMISSIILPFIPVYADTLKDSYTGTSDTDSTTYGTAYIRGATFTTGSAYTLSTVDVYMRRLGTPGTCTLFLKATDVNQKPTGSVLTSGTLSSASIGTSDAWVNFDVTNIDLTTSTQYYIGVYAASGDGSGNYYAFRSDNGGTYSGGAVTNSSDSGSTWTIYSTYKGLFKTYEVSLSAPSITTSSASSVSATAATMNGNITDSGGATVTTRGFEWDADTGAPYANDWHEDGTFSTGSFPKALSGLTESDTYYFRAYAINSEGTTYGSELTFNTIPASTLTDNYDTTVTNTDSTTWNTVNIRGQTFTASASYTLSSIDIRARRYGNPGNVTLNIKAVDGASKPTGAAIATATIASSLVPTAEGWVNFNVSDVALTSGTKYWFGIYAASGDSENNYIDFRSTSAAGYANGALTNSSTSGSTWNIATTHDAPFRTYNDTLVETDATVSTLATNTGTYKTAGVTSFYAEGLVTDDGVGGVEWAFDYDVDTGAPYASTTAWSGSDVRYTNGSFGAFIGGFTAGDTIYYRAKVRKNGTDEYVGSEKNIVLTATYADATQTNWLTGYTYRDPIYITGSTGSGTDYVLSLTVNSGVGTNSVGNIYLNNKCSVFPTDIRFTAKDGKTVIPYGTETSNGSARKFYVRITEDDISSDTLIFIYYGGPNTFVDLPPVGPWTNASAYSIYGGSSDGVCSEGIVWDSATSKYWWLFDDRSSGNYQLRMASSASITGPWVVESSYVLPRSSGMNYDAPFITKFGNTWYLYYEWQVPSSGLGSLYLATSSTVNSGYTIVGQVMTQGSGWDSRRVTEPHVLLDDDGVYKMIFMAQEIGTGLEKFGLATAPAPAGPWTKYAGNPVYSGSSITGAWNAGTAKAADISIYKHTDGKFYGVFAATRTGFTDAPYGVIVSEDLITWTDFGGSPVLDHGAAGTWDSTYGEGRTGHIIKVGDTWYLPYGAKGTGTPYYSLGLATAPAVGTVLGYPLQQVFYIYEDFSKYAEGALPMPLFRSPVAGWGISNHQLVKVAATNGSSTARFINSNNVIVEATVQHSSGGQEIQFHQIKTGETGSTSQTGYTASLGISGIGTSEGGVSLGSTLYSGIVTNSVYSASWGRYGGVFNTQIGNAKNSVTDATPVNVWAIGVRTSSTGTGVVDNFKVRKYTSLEPWIEIPGGGVSPIVISLDVTTDDATNVGSSSATLQSYVFDDNGDNCQVRFNYGTSITYTDSTSWQSGMNTGDTVSQIISGLISYTTYHFRAEIRDESGNVDYGLDKTFITSSIPPSNPSNFSVVSATTDTINLSWSPGLNSTKTLIRYSASSYPLTVTDGIELFLGTGSSYSHTGLSSGQKVFYTAWGERSGSYSYLYARVAGAATVGGLQHPDTIEIVDVDIYKDYAAIGDRLFLISYKLIYLSEDPSMDVSDYFAIEIRDSGVLKSQIRPIMWGYRVASVYQNSISALDWGVPYTVKIVGLSSKFGDDIPSDSMIVTSGDWIGNDKNVLSSWVLQTANNIGSYYGGSLTTYTSSGQKLNADNVLLGSTYSSGSEIFGSSISGLRVYVPSLFASSSSLIDKPTDDAHPMTLKTESTIDVRWGVGTEANLDLLGTSMLAGVAGKDIYLLIWIILIFIVAFALFTTGSATLSGVGAIIIGVVGAWMGADLWAILGISGAVLTFMVLFDYLKNS